MTASTMTYIQLKSAISSDAIAHSIAFYILAKNKMVMDLDSNTDESKFVTKVFKGSYKVEDTLDMIEKLNLTYDKIISANNKRFTSVNSVITKG